MNLVHTGVGGNVLINEKAARVGVYNVWDYAEGQDSYQSSMLVDLTQPPEQVCNVSLPTTLWPRRAIGRLCVCLSVCLCISVYVSGR